jgi:hypothetical protein
VAGTQRANGRVIDGDRGYAGTMDYAPAQPLIHIEDFRMQFGEKTVIDGLSFDVARG